MGDFLVPITVQARGADDTALGANLVYSWSKVSGPGDVTFLAPQASDTGVQFSEPGSYVLRSTVSDGDHLASAEITVEQRFDETSIRLQHTQNGVVSPERISTITDGVFTASVGDGLSVQFSNTSYYGWNDWGGTFRMPLGRQILPGRIALAPQAATTSTGNLTLRNYYGYADGTFFEIKYLRLNPDSTVASCWIVFEFKDWNDVIKGEFRYRSTGKAAPKITFPEKIQYDFGYQSAVQVQVEAGDPAAGGPAPTFKWSAPDSEDVLFISPATAGTEVGFPGPGVFRLRVTATDGDQTSEDDMFVHVTPRGEQWSGLIEIPDRAARGYVDLTASTMGAVTGVLRIGKVRIPFTGNFDSGEIASVPFEYEGLQGILVLSPGENGLLKARLNYHGGFRDSSLFFHHKANPNSIPAEPLGTYALSVVQPHPQNPPAYGFGWGRIVFRNTGMVSVVVALPDGSRASGSVPVDATASFAMVLTPSKTKDWISLEAFLDQSSFVWSGRAHWMRQKRASKPALDEELVFEAPRAVRLYSRWNPLTETAQSVPATLVLQIAGLPPYRVPLRVGRAGRTSNVGAGRFAASCTIGANGVFSGYVFRPGTLQMIRFSGVLMPNRSLGLGYCILGSRSGIAGLVWE